MPQGGNPVTRREIATGLVAAGALVASGQLGNVIAADPAAEPRRVFAHYMVCCPMGGSTATAADFAREIQQAQAHGIDGFALNCGSWTVEPNYREHSLRMFEAAASLGTGFKLFFSADGTAEEAIAMASEFYDHPNTLRFNARPVLSTFGGDDAFAATILGAMRKVGKPLTFVPFFFPSRRGEKFGDFTPADFASYIARHSYMDGFFYFGAGAEPDEIAQTSLKIGEAWQRAGKPYMAPVTPYYRGLGPKNYRLFETRGFEGMALEWEAAIKSHAQWIEIVTWNDWGESTYVAEFGPPRSTDLWEGHWGRPLSHSAYLSASSYYIGWFKTGAPQIDRDALYWFYRLSPKEVPGHSSPDDRSLSFPEGSETLEDRVFVTAFLTAEARISIDSGTRHYEFVRPAGVHHVSGAFALGAQNFSLERGGHTIVSGQGAFPITEDNWANFNYFAGQAENRL